MAFNLEMYPVTYIASYDAQAGKWNEQFIETDTITYEQLQAMSDAQRTEVFLKRNRFDLPLVNYSTQYGLGCFEGMKAVSTKSGDIALFRPDRNAARFASSMKALYSPAFPEDMFVNACTEFVRRNAALGYIPSYNAEWEKDNFASASASYMRPFMYSEAGIGIGVSASPYVIICATTVSSYFKGGNTKATTTKRIRATENGTGWVKCNSNYVLSALAKKEAEAEGFMEVIFLDAKERKYIEEGSSCNIFFHLKNGELVTPDLGDTILPGITRSSIIDLARDEGVTVVERKISIDEVMSDAQACFVTGTAAGITPIESITHNGVEAVFNDRKPGALGEKLQRRLKGIQYGSVTDDFNWNFKV